MVAVEIATAVLVVVAGLAMVAMGWVGVMAVLGEQRMVRCRDCGHLCLVRRQQPAVCHHCAVLAVRAASASGGGRTGHARGGGTAPTSGRPLVTLGHREGRT